MGLGARDLTDHLEALDIPYTVAIETMTFRKRKQAGFTVQVARDDFGAVTRWVPSFQKSIDAAEKKWEEDPTGPTYA